MTKIVFACKSNSCRSQMAEGWARDWIRRRREELDRTLSFTSLGDDSDRSGGSLESPTTIPGTADRSELLRRSSALDEVVVTSVALDSSSVFECGTCRRRDGGDLLCETAPSQRKVVKEKAVRAMAEDGVDISSFVPKTIEEIAPCLADKAIAGRPPSEGSDDCTKQGEPAERGVPAAEVIPAVGSAAIEQISAAYSSTLFLSDGVPVDGLPGPRTAESDGSDFSGKKPVDKLIVLCSCGDDVKRTLVRRSKSVEEWNVDAPTAAARREGDGAYRRVSREIRREVNVLLDSLLLSDDERARGVVSGAGDDPGGEEAGVGWHPGG